MDGSIYKVVRDISGSVRYLVDIEGRIAAQYKYDAHGVCKVYDGKNAVNTSSTFIGNKFPIRWKGYYYDTETGLYYNGGRYYDPEIGKYLDACGVEEAIAEEQLDRNGIMCDNIFELMPYICTVLMGLAKDPTSGESDSATNGGGIPWWAWLIFGLGAALVTMSMAVLTLGVGALAGTMTGAVLNGAATGALIGAGIGTGIGIGAGAIYAGVTGDDLLTSMLIGGMIGFGIGAVVGAIVGGIHGAIGFARNSAYIMRYGGNVKETLSAFRGNPKLKQIAAGSNVNRYWGGAARQIGRWVTPSTYVNPVNSLALNPMWGNTAANVSTLVFNQNVTVLVGKAAAQGILSGGGFQWFIGNLAWLSLL